MAEAAKEEKQSTMIATLRAWLAIPTMELEFPLKEPNLEPAQKEQLDRIVQRKNYINSIIEEAKEMEKDPQAARSRLTHLENYANYGIEVLKDMLNEYKRKQKEAAKEAEEREIDVGV